MQLTVVLSVAAAGALGALCRYVATVLLRSLLGEGPWPVAVVNVVGCFGFGLCWALLHERVSQTVSVAVLAGFFGAFTTFSAFAFDGHQLLDERRVASFALNVLLQNVLGVAALWLGMTLASRS
ncbi:MAG: fluoride efflux transporter FluC [Planctomycetota bacterium]|jgi:CrcB protein